jgi:glycogen debranching enzyme
VDIVLNHTANNSHWIADHPEACFSTDIIPRLWPGWLVDETFTILSDEFSRVNTPWCKSAPYLRNEEDLNQIIEEMRKRLNLLNL